MVEIARVRRELESHDQSHWLQSYDSLDPAEQAALLERKLNKIE